MRYFQGSPRCAENQLAIDLKSLMGNHVRVRVPPQALNSTSDCLNTAGLFFFNTPQKLRTTSVIQPPKSKNTYGYKRFGFAGRRPLIWPLHPSPHRDHALPAARRQGVRRLSGATQADRTRKEHPDTRRCFLKAVLCSSILDATIDRSTGPGALFSLPQSGAPS